jgi:hypothetical protein
MVGNAEEREKRFLLELTTLTRKYGVSIGGCGCCGSPWLDSTIIPTDPRAGYSMTSGCVKWVDPSDEYDWRNYASGIVRE